jgi:hypothetical protein
MQDVFIRFVPLPIEVEGITIPNEDLTFDVYINSNLCRRKQEETMEHELNHIKKDHFWSINPVWMNERDAG